MKKKHFAILQTESESESHEEKKSDEQEKGVETSESD